MNFIKFDKTYKIVFLSGLFYELHARNLLQADILLPS